MEYRPVPASRMQEFENVAHYAFFPTDEPVDSDRIDDPSVQFGEPRALFEGDEMAAICRVLELDARCRDDWITLGGLRGVATPPEHRRSGRAAALIEETLAEFTERDVPLVALWPFDHDFYAGLGWASAAKHVTYRLPPSALAPLATNETGRSFRPSVDEWERLHDVNLAAGEGVSLSLRRTEDWWRHRVFERSSTKRHVYVWERNGDVEGYVAYNVDRDEGDLVLEVQDLAAVDYRAFRHLCWLLYNHDSQIDEIELPGKPDATPGSLLDRVASPESVTCELEHGAMVRATDVPAAVSALSYPTDLDADLVVEVADEFVERNDDAFHVAFADGRATCRRVEDGSDAPDVTVDVGTLSQLLVGYRAVERARTDGDLTVREEDTVDVLNRAFPPRPVELSEFF